MCGIVGYIGPQPAAPILVEGLRALEYRGYDSAGIALAPGDGDFRLVRASGKLSALQARVDFTDTTPLGIGHTRWATHGRPTEENAHPHLGGGGQDERERQETEEAKQHHPFSQGVSATGVKGPLPANHDKRLSTTSCPMPRRV